MRHGPDKPIEIDVRVRPRANRDEIADQRDGRLVVRVTAPPVDGKANTAVCAMVARALGVAKSRVTVIRGQSSRDKTLAVDGVTSAQLEALRHLKGE